MSLHKIPLTTLEKSGLLAHGLDTGKPSQLSDVFRHGVSWALNQSNTRHTVDVEELAREIAYKVQYCNEWFDMQERLKWAYCKDRGSDSIVGLDSCDDYKEWLKNLTP